VNLEALSVAVMSLSDNQRAYVLGYLIYCAPEALADAVDSALVKVPTL
jgi:hypothetical protein